MTTRSSIEPDLPSVPLERPPLGRTGDELVDRPGGLAGHEPGGHVSLMARPIGERLGRRRPAAASLDVSTPGAAPQTHREVALPARRRPAEASLHVATAHGVTSSPRSQRPPQNTVSGHDLVVAHLEHVHVVGGVRACRRPRRCAGSAPPRRLRSGCRSTVSSSLGQENQLVYSAAIGIGCRGPGSASPGTVASRRASSAYRSGARPDPTARLQEHGRWPSCSSDSWPGGQSQASGSDPAVLPAVDCQVA